MKRAAFRPTRGTAATHAARGLGVALAVCLFPGCAGREREPAPAAQRALPDGVAALVADEPVSSSSVREIAVRRKVGVAQARDWAVDDALFAVGARARLGAAQRAERQALSRALLNEIKAQMAALGPATDEEVERLTRARWTEIDRPAAVRTVHVVVLVKDDTERASARRLAERIRGAVDGASTPEEFMRQVDQVDGGDLEIRAERLPPVAKDGRVVMKGPRAPEFDRMFAAAAFALESPGELSDVVETRFGYHVILLEERLPEHRPSRAERGRLLHDDVLRQRGQKRVRELVQSLRARVNPEIDRAALDLTQGAVMP